VSNQRTGKVYISIDGLPYESMDGAKLTGAEGIERDAVTGTAVFGYFEKTTVPTIDCEFAHGAFTSVMVLNAVKNSTITFACDSGWTYLLLNAWKSKATEITGGKGSMSVQFQGKKCTELPPI
jgi:hypothetical protein